MKKIVESDINKNDVSFWINDVIQKKYVNSKKIDEKNDDKMDIDEEILDYKKKSNKIKKI